MSFSKREEFSAEDRALAAIFRAFAHPARLFIMRVLAQEGPKYVYELEAMMPMTQSSVSHHLRLLRSEDLIRVEEHRLHNSYALNLERFDEVMRIVDDFLSQIAQPPLSPLILNGN